MSALSPYIQKKLESAKARAATYREKAKELGTSAMHTAESMGAAGVIGYLETKRESEGKEHLSIFGFDIEEALALGGHAAVLFGVVSGPEADHVRAVANGAAGVYAYKRGRDLGQPRANALPGA